MSEPVTLQEVLRLARQLPLAEQVRLIEQIAGQTAQQIEHSPQQRRSLRGIWPSLDTPPEDIDQARREVWGGFPRQDL
jgi:hypothetical protein